MHRLDWLAFHLDVHASDLVPSARERRVPAPMIESVSLTLELFNGLHQTWIFAPYDLARLHFLCQFRCTRDARAHDAAMCEDERILRLSPYGQRGLVYGSVAVCHHKYRLTPPQQFRHGMPKGGRLAGSRWSPDERDLRRGDVRDSLLLIAVR